MTAGVNEFVGGSGNDNFDASTTANSLNDFDNIDGGGEFCSLFEILKSFEKRFLISWKLLVI